MTKIIDWDNQDKWSVMLSEQTEKCMVCGVDESLSLHHVDQRAVGHFCSRACAQKAEEQLESRSEAQRE